jgi:hypothetical protein
VRDDPDHHLERHQPDDQPERDREVASIGVGAHAVRMSIAAGVMMVTVVIVSGVIVPAVVVDRIHPYFRF